MAILEKINGLMQIAHTDRRTFPATILYNEGWLLRLVLDWFSRNRVDGHPLNFASGTRWYSEALLPSPFLAYHRTDRLAEGWTHADGVIGHVAVGSAALADVKLAEGCQQLLVTEAKLFSRLSPRVTNASYFDQAARNVACIVEVLRRANRRPDKIDSLGFYVIAPQSQIVAGVFEDNLSRVSIEKKVRRRVGEYSEAQREEKEIWLQDWFLPSFSRMTVQTLSWEDVAKAIHEKDEAFGDELRLFYLDCLKFNRLQEPDVVV